MSIRTKDRRKTATSREPDSVVPVHLITLREAAAIIGLSPRTLARLVTLDGMKKLFFKPEELLALLQPTTVRPGHSHRATPSSQEPQ